MPDPMPNCVIAVNFFLPELEFTFTCTHRALSWQVESDGRIQPPPTGRLIRFEARGMPDPVEFAGFQVAATHGALQATTEPWPPMPSEVTLNVPPLGPPGGVTADPLILGLPQQWLVYRLAVKDVHGVVHWTDPRIYNDGSE